MQRKRPREVSVVEEEESFIEPSAQRRKMSPVASAVAPTLTAPASTCPSQIFLHVALRPFLDVTQQQLFRVELMALIRGYISPSEYTAYTISQLPIYPYPLSVLYTATEQTVPLIMDTMPLTLINASTIIPSDMQRLLWWLEASLLFYTFTREAVNGLRAVVTGKVAEWLKATPTERQAPTDLALFISIPLLPRSPVPRVSSDNYLQWEASQWVRLLPWSFVEASSNLKGRLQMAPATMTLDGTSLLLSERPGVIFTSAAYSTIILHVTQAEVAAWSRPELVVGYFARELFLFEEPSVGFAVLRARQLLTLSSVLFSIGSSIEDRPPVTDC